MRKITTGWILVLAATPAMAQQTYTVGQAVEIEASKHWVPCVVMVPGELVRVRCPEYAPLSRGAGVYTAYNDAKSIRPATGKVGLAPATAPAAKTTGAISGLKLGEYACYGSGGRQMIGLGFQVLAGNRFTDLDGKNPGSFTVSAATVTFKGGHLGGQSGRDLNNGRFRLGTQASCEPW